jgi:4-hydroxy-tetrahydrodipicolinate synthase
MIPLLRGMGRVGGAVFSKVALRLTGLDVGDPRLPLPPATEEQVALIAADLMAGGVALDQDRVPHTRPADSAYGALGRRTTTDLGAEVAYR